MFKRLVSFYNSVTGKKYDYDVIIYQMGKVGSMSVMNGISESISVAHMHSFYHPVYTKQFCNYKVVKDYCKSRNINHENIIKNLLDPIFVRFALKNSRNKHKIISIVREPISRNMSMYFQDFQFPVFENYILNNNRSNSGIEYFVFDFFKKFNHFYGVNWFDNEFKKTTKIDVYQYPFDTNNGWCIINLRNYDILIIQMERMNSLVYKIRDFIGDKDFILNKENTGNMKWYRQLYSEFKQNINFPKDYIDSLYKTKFMEHFYSLDDIQMFRNKYARN